MAGTKLGGKKAARTNKRRHGKDFYVKIGAKGGSVSGISKGFSKDREAASRAGMLGGRISRPPHTREPKRTLRNRIEAFLR